MHHCPVHPGTFRCSWQLKSPPSTTQSVLRMDCSRLFSYAMVSCAIGFCFLPLWGIHDYEEDIADRTFYSHLGDSCAHVPFAHDLVGHPRGQRQRDDNSCRWIRALAFLVDFCGRTAYPTPSLEFRLCVVQFG